MWHDDQFAGGAFALFEPGQQTLLHEHIIAPEGRIHFAGEHASLAHAWIQGAIESGSERRGCGARRDHREVNKNLRADQRGRRRMPSVPVAWAAGRVAGTADRRALRAA